MTDSNASLILGVVNAVTFVIVVVVAVVFVVAFFVVVVDHSVLFSS